MTLNVVSSSSSERKIMLGHFKNGWHGQNIEELMKLEDLEGLRKTKEEGNENSSV